MKQRTYIVKIKEHKEYVEAWIESPTEKLKTYYKYKKGNDEWAGFGGYLVGCMKLFEYNKAKNMFEVESIADIK